MNYPNPIYDAVRLDLSIDPADFQGHEIRMIHLMDKHRSKMIDRAGEYTPSAQSAFKRANNNAPKKKGR